MYKENEIDFSDLVQNEVPETEKINPDTADIKPLQENLVSRYNPFTKTFEKVPPNWRLQRDTKTAEWHFRPDV